MLNLYAKKHSIPLIISFTNTPNLASNGQRYWVFALSYLASMPVNVNIQNSPFQDHYFHLNQVQVHRSKIKTISNLGFLPHNLKPRPRGEFKINPTSTYHKNTFPVRFYITNMAKDHLRDTTNY